jgi:hypothetical protein
MSAVRAQSAVGSFDVLGGFLRLAVVVLALATSYIHSMLGGLMFTANALGYAVFAGLMVAPFAVASRHRWLVRAGLLGFAAATIFGWVLFGGRFTLAYVDKAIEIGLIAALLIEIGRYDGGPINVLRRLVELASRSGARRFPSEESNGD